MDAAAAWRSNPIAPRSSLASAAGVTTGAPIALLIPNKDWVNWQRTMHTESRDAARGATGANSVARRAATAGPRRPCRRPQVRSRRHSRRARTRQRARDRRARRRRCRRAPAPRAHRRRPSSATSPAIGAVVDGRRRSGGRRSTTSRRCPTTVPLHCVDAHARAAHDRRHRSRRATPATRSAGRSR